VLTSDENENNKDQTVSLYITRLHRGRTNRMLTFRKNKLLLDVDLFNKSLIMLLLLSYLILLLFISNKIVWISYLLLAAILVMARKKIVIGPVQVLFLLVVPHIWCLFMSFNDSLIQSVKGFFYLSVPLIMIFTGFQLKRLFTYDQFFKWLSGIGTVISLIYIILTLARVGFISFISPYAEARYSVGPGSPAVVMSLILALFSEKFGIKIFNTKTGRNITILINLLAIYLFASRTFWVMLIVYIVFFSIKIFKRENLPVLAGLALTAVLAVVIITNARTGLTFSNSILYKFVNSFSEIRMGDFKTDSDINSFYRGFETYRSWKTYTGGTIPELFFGGGYGKLIDLETEVKLAGEYWTRIPIVHNGFFFVLVKEGALGLIFNILLFFKIIGTGLLNYRAKQEQTAFISVFLIATGTVLILVNYVDCGMYTLEMTILMITTGFLLQGLSHRKEKANSPL
jgi:hypothetical protein